MSFTYLKISQNLNHNKLLENTLDKLDKKDKLNKYNCLEIGSGNCSVSIPLSKYFNTYTAIEPNERLFNICKSNIEYHKSDIKLYNSDFKKFFINNKKNNFHIILFINSFHFMDLTDNLMLENLKNSCIIIVHPCYDSDNFGDTKLNKDSHDFNKELYEKNKQNLNKYEDFIKIHFDIHYNNSNRFYKIFILTVK